MNARTEIAAAALLCVLYVVCLWQIADAIRPVLRCGAC